MKLRFYFCIEAHFPQFFLYSSAPQMLASSNNLQAQQFAHPLLSLSSNTFVQQLQPHILHHLMQQQSFQQQQNHFQQQQMLHHIKSLGFLLQHQQGQNKNNNDQQQQDLIAFVSSILQRIMK